MCYNGAMTKQETHRQNIYFPVELIKKIKIIQRKEMRHRFSNMVVVLLSQIVEQRRDEWEAEYNEQKNISS